MKIGRVIESELSPAETYEMLVTPAYQEMKCRDAGALSWEVHVEPGPSGAIVRARRKLPTDTFPALLRKFVPSGVTSTETIRWDDWAADGSRTGHLSVDFHGAPVSMKGTLTIQPHADTAALVVVDAEFKAHVPLVGKKVEQLAAPIITRVIEAEDASGRAWAAGQRS